MFSKLFGKKKDNFYLELKEDQNGSAPKPEAVTQPSEVTPPPAPEVKPAPAAEEEPKKSKKTSVKKDKKVAATKEATAPVQAPVPVTPAPTNGKVESKEVEFATKYSITPSLSRRRPGPSLNAFKDMAKKAKVPNK